MSRPIVKIHDIASGEVTEREMNDEEFASYVAFQEQVAEGERKAEEQKTARKAVLDRLGLSEDEAKVLFS